MPTSTHLDDLKINVLTESQFDAAVQGGVIGAGEISMITDLDEAIQVSTLPTAAAGEEGKIYQFIGTTDANYTHGYFYECVSDGQNPATYSWSQTNVQPTPSELPDQTGQSGKYLTTNGTTASWGTVDTLPSQTGNAGKFLTTDGTDASWSDKIKITDNESSVYLGTTGSNTWGNTVSDSVVIGKNTKADNGGSIIIGSGAYSYGASAFDEIVIGTSSHTGTNAGTNVIVCNHATTTNNANYAVIVGGYGNSVSVKYAMQFGGLNMTNSEQGTIKFATYYNKAWQNNKLMDADGTIPTDRFTTTPSADGTYVPTLTISSGTATRTWGEAASAPVVPATMPTLAVADWSSNTQTVNVTGVTSSNIVFVSPAPASAADYAAAGIVCTAQGSGTLTFTCTTVPSNAITVNVVILG